VRLKDDGTITAKIIDLGLAKAVDEQGFQTAISLPGIFAGTPEFASPEQFAGIQVDIRSDLYEKQIAELFDAHPDSFLFRDLPGAGSALAPRLLTAFGTDRGRFDNPTELLSLSGIASIRRASGKKTGRSS
jgi:serine/threonine protein kinase